MLKIQNSNYFTKKPQATSQITFPNSFPTPYHHPYTTLIWSYWGSYLHFYNLTPHRSASFPQNPSIYPISLPGRCASVKTQFAFLIANNLFPPCEHITDINRCLFPNIEHPPLIVNSTKTKIKNHILHICIFPSIFWKYFVKIPKMLLNNQK